MTRDSILLYVGAVSAFLTYIAVKPPTQWDYQEWIQFGMAVCAYIIGKLQSSPLRGEND